MLDLDDLKPPSQEQVIELDWDAYFIEFQMQHGGEPVIHQPTRRLLFRDGWMYSAVDTRGPEWEPPKDPPVLAQLLLDYWSTRRAIVWNRLESLRGQVAEFKEMQRLRSAPLQRRVVIVDENGKSSVKTAKLDTQILETQLSIFQNALDECDEQLVKLRKPLNKDQ